MPIQSSLDVIRDALLQSKPTGGDGFEGLTAELLARWAGLHVRSARSGYQAGHDGGTVRHRISMLFEAKRYDSTSVSLRELLGELDLVLQDHPDLDLYVVASTTRLGTLFEQRMGRQADSAGAEILLLDWDGDLPLLAVFLAGEAGATLAWFERHMPCVDRQTLAAALDDVGANPGFPASAASISFPLSAATLGLQTLRDKTASALAGLFQKREEAHRLFKQHLAPADVELGAIERRPLIDAVGAWFHDRARSRFLAVLGDEGVGKSWTIPQWWLAQGADRPILLIATSNFVRDHRSVEDGRRFLAELIAFTLDEIGGETVDRWVARLGRWSAAASPPGRFLVILDGLNEATSVDWPSLIATVARCLAALGGKLAVTCRRAFFNHEIRDRLPSAQAYTVLPVGAFKTEELNAAAAARGVDISSMGAEVRKFIANPRIFAMAAGLLPELVTGQLTVPRLLMLAWRHRMSERGHFVVHNDDDMCQLVASHGRAIKQGRTSFDVNAWKEHSSRSRRSTNISLDDDLTEVVDGTFCEEVPNCRGEYRIRDHAFGFALGLMLIDELRVAAPTNRGLILADALDQLSGFDRTAEILAAAVAVAMLAPSFDPSICEELLCTWLDLQNLRQRDHDEFVAYAVDRPEVYLDVVERVFAVAACANRMWPVVALREASADPRVASLVRSRCRAWMGCWHFGDRYPPVQTDNEAHRIVLADQARERIGLIGSSIEALSEVEREVFERTCWRVDSVHLPNIALVVPLLLAGQPLADCVDGLVGWMLAIEVGERSIKGAGIAWVFDLNPVDFDATSAACLAAAEDLLRIATCRATRNAAGRLFSMSGTRDGDRRSRDVFEMPPAFVGFTGHDDRPDPLDPGAAEHSMPADAPLGEFDPSTIRANFGTSPQDHELDRLAPALARFSPDPLVRFWRAAVADITGRDAMGIRQLIIELPRLSALFETDQIAAVRALLAALHAPDHFLRREANIATPGYLAQALLPHLDGDAQLDFLAGMPPDVSWPDDIHRFLVTASPQHFESVLASALEGGVLGAAGPILLFAVDGRQEMTSAAIDMIARCLDDSAPYVRSLVFRVAVSNRLHDVMARHYEGTWTGRQTTSYEAYFGSIALAQAAKAKKVVMPFARMASEVHGYAAGIGTRDDQEVWIAGLSMTVGRVVSAAPSRLPPVDLARSTAHGAFEASFPYFVSDRDEAHEKGEATFADMLLALEPNAAFAQRSEENAARTRRIDELLESLQSDSITLLADAPSSHGFDEAARWGKERVRDLAQSFLAMNTEAATSRVRNLAMSLVPTLSRLDGDLAAELFMKMFEVPSFMPFRMGVEGTPFDLDVLFAAADIPRFAAIRNQVARCAANDASLARFVLSAQRRGKEALVRETARTAIFSGHPGETALGMTLLGFCDAIDDEVARLLQPFLDGRGFLARAARSAMDAHKMNCRARLWAASAESAPHPIDFWRFGELMTACVDYRYVLWYRPPVVRGTTPWSRFAMLLEPKLARNGSRIADARKKTLYGNERPSVALAAQIGLNDGLSPLRGDASLKVPAAVAS